MGPLTEGRTAGLRFVALFLLSAALIGYELAVMRVYSVGSWSNFGAMVISIALLGFGLAGTLLTFIQKSIRSAPDRWLAALALAFMPAMALAHMAAQAVPFNPVMIVSDRRQLLWIGAYYLIYGIPFFIGALFINASFVVLSSRVHSLYFWNMAGSGVGGLFILLFMYLLPPDQLTIPLIALSGVTAALCLIEEEGGRLRLRAERMMAAGGTLLVSAALVLMFGKISVSEFKGISYARNFADATLHYHSYSPLGEMHVYGSSAFHFAPGLSDNASLNLAAMPRNAYRGLYIDGGGPIGIMRSLQPSEQRYMDYLPMSAPYLVLDRPRVLLVGLGGGIGAFTALYHGASLVQVVEPNPDLIHLLRDVPEFRAYTGDLLRDPRVRVAAAEPRAFTSGTRGTYDLVEISLIDSVGLSQAGGYSVDPNYTYTVEAIEDYMKSLAPGGVLSITVWNKLNPPRNVPKLLSTVVESLREQGVENPERRVFAFHLLLSTATVLVKNSPFTDEEVAKLREFCRRLSFQVIAYPGMPAPEGSFQAMLRAYWDLFALPPQTQEPGDEPAPVPQASASASPVPDSGDFYRHMTRALLDGRARDLYTGYVFNILPATDLRPFYTAYIKPSTIPMFLDQLGNVSEEWGYLLLLGTLLQSILFGLLIVLVPLAGRWRELFAGYRGTVGIIVYYASLGLAYMLVEIFLIQKLSFFVADPIFAVSIVITSMLIISGLGSLSSGRLARLFRGAGGTPQLTVRLAAAGIAVSLLFYIFGLSPLIRAALGLPFLVRALIAVAVVAPAAFFMGMPFPTGLSSLEKSHERLIPWAMGMNGALSVTGSVTAKLVSIAWGFPAVLALAVALYLVVGLVFPANLAADRR